MPFRAKCPTCGRRQSVQEADEGHLVWCAACGTKYEALQSVSIEAEPETAADGLLRHTDEPPVPSTTSAPAVSISAPPIAGVSPFPAAGLSSGSNTSSTSQLVSVPMSKAAPAATDSPLPLQQRLAAPADSMAQVPEPKLSHRPFVSPPPTVEAPAPSSLLPVFVTLGLIAGVILMAGVFLLGFWFGSHRQPPLAQLPAIARPQTSHSATPIVQSLQPTSKPADTDTAVIETNRTVGTTILPTASSATPHVAVMPLPLPSHEIAPEDLLAAAKFHPVHPQSNGVVELDEQIGQAIDRGVKYLLSQLHDGQLRLANGNDSGMAAGMDALAVYALLQAGEATHDPRLGPNSPLVAQMLDALKKLSMDQTDSTYARALRSAALGVYHRAEDKQAMHADAAWLIAESNNGAFTYEPSHERPERAGMRGRVQLTGAWDNSNSQYGALGVWAALDAGVEVPNSFWQAVQKHWLGCQLPDGEWAYTGYGDMGRMSMTVAGITTLLVTEDQLDARATLSTLGHPPFASALLRGLNWLEAGDNSVRLPADWRTYNLFGLERAALASGFKYFGTHDWYRELARDQIALEEPNGSWMGSHPIVDTSYTLLFLSRGRHPIFMNKLRFETYWANRPRDIANLSHYATTVLERPVNWQVVSTRSDWSDWMDSPVLYIAGHEPLNFSEDVCDKLRSYAQNGGLIFTHADGDTPAFSKSVAELAHKLFPDYPLEDLAPGNSIFNSLYKIKSPPRLQGVSNGSRLVLVHSPTDLNKAWQQRDFVGHPVPFQIGINIFIYAAGKTNLKNKLKTPYVPEPVVTPILTTQLARLRQSLESDPEPAAWPRFSRLFLGETSVKLDVVDVQPTLLDPKRMPVAQLSGTRAIHYDPPQLQALQAYVENGGILIIDACGGSKTFTDSLFLDLLPHAFPKSSFADLPNDHPILAGTGRGMTPVNLKLRAYRSETDGVTTQPVQFITLGKGMVFLSTVDLTTALLGTNTWGVNGYTPETAFDLVRNIVLFALEK